MKKLVSNGAFTDAFNLAADGVASALKGAVQDAIPVPIDGKDLQRRKETRTTVVSALEAAVQQNVDTLRRELAELLAKQPNAPAVQPVPMLPRPDDALGEILTTLYGHLHSLVVSADHQLQRLDKLSLFNRLTGDIRKKWAEQGGDLQPSLLPNLPLGQRPGPLQTNGYHIVENFSEGIRVFLPQNPTPEFELKEPVTHFELTQDHLVVLVKDQLRVYRLTDLKAAPKTVEVKDGQRVCVTDTHIAVVTASSVRVFDSELSPVKTKKVTNVTTLAMNAETIVLGMQDGSLNVWSQFSNSTDLVHVTRHNKSEATFLYFVPGKDDVLVGYDHNIELFTMVSKIDPGATVSPAWNYRCHGSVLSAMSLVRIPGLEAAADLLWVVTQGDNIKVTPFGENPGRASMEYRIDSTKVPASVAACPFGIVVRRAEGSQVISFTAPYIGDRRPNVAAYAAGKAGGLILGAIGGAFGALLSTTRTAASGQGAESASVGEG